MKKLTNCAFILLALLSHIVITKAQTRFGDSWTSGEPVPWTSVVSMALSPDGKVLAMPDNGYLKFYNALTGTLTKELPFDNEKGLLTWSKDGSYLISTVGPTQFIDTATASVFKTFPFFSQSQPARYSPTGKYLIIDKNIIDTENWTEVNSLLAYTDFFEILPGDTTAITMAYKGDDTIRLVSFPSGNPISAFPVELSDNVKRGLALSHSAKQFAVIGDSATYIISASDGKILTKLQTGAEITSPNRVSIEFSQDDRLVLIDKRLIWDIEKGMILNKIQKKTVPYSFKVMTFTTDWRRFYGMTNSSLIALNNTSEILWENYIGHYLNITSINFEPETITTIGQDSIQITWDKKTGKILKSARKPVLIENDSIAPEISPLGKYALKKADAPYTLVLFDNQTTSVLDSITIVPSGLTVKTDIIWSWAWSPDEKNIFISRKTQYSSTWDTYFDRIYSYSITSRKIIDSIRVPKPIHLLKISPDATYLVGVFSRISLIKIDLKNEITGTHDAVFDNLIKTILYPNPLKESSIISCSIANPGLLKISVHDIFGREVALLKNGFSEAGNYTIPLKSAEFANGTYFLKVMSEMGSEVVSFQIMR